MVNHIEHIEACFHVEKYASNKLYKTAWLKIIRALATRDNMLDKIELYICLSDGQTTQVKPKISEYMDMEGVERIINCLDDEFLKEYNEEFN